MTMPLIKPLLSSVILIEGLFSHPYHLSPIISCTCFFESFDFSRKAFLNSWYFCINTSTKLHEHTPPMVSILNYMLRGETNGVSNFLWANPVHISFKFVLLRPSTVGKLIFRWPFSSSIVSVSWIASTAIWGVKMRKTQLKVRQKSLSVLPTGR